MTVYFVFLHFLRFKGICALFGNENIFFLFLHVAFDTKYFVSSYIFKFPFFFPCVSNDV